MKMPSDCLRFFIVKKIAYFVKKHDKNTEAVVVLKQFQKTTLMPIVVCTNVHDNIRLNISHVFQAI